VMPAAAAIIPTAEPSQAGEPLPSSPSICFARADTSCSTWIS
jgi:hypothetical protein